MIFLGRVNNASLPHRQGILALFEAVINSIDSIQESGTDDGQIDIKIIRQGLFTDPEEREHDPIIGFEVIDNGKGFTEENFDSFNTSDTTRKLEIGGKGVGRFFWLKVFKKIHIDSVFIEDGKKKRRSFDFELDRENPIKNPQILDVDPQEAIQTSIKLLEIKPEYASHISGKADSLLQRLLEYCLVYFVVGIMPNLLVYDYEDVFDLHKQYQEFVKNSEKSECEIDGNKFEFRHFLLEAHTGLNHQIIYCADRRVVNSTKLTSSNIPHLPKRIAQNDEDDALVYMEYVQSQFLDDNVNLQRTDFVTYSDGELSFLGDIEWSNIEDSAIDEAGKFLDFITEPTKEETNRTVKDFVKNQAPQFRYLIKRHPEVVDQIPPGSSEQTIRLELYKSSKENEMEVSEAVQEIITAQDTDLLDPEGEINRIYNKYLEEISEIGKAALAEYVVQRRKTLDILERYMSLDEEENYAREKAIHNLIFPMKSTSDDIPYDRQNLWIIDERLSFHEYLASDLSFRQNQKTESDSLNRPDLIIYDLPIAVAEDESINGITIFEFKRPMKAIGNPVSQMYDYVRELRSNKAINHKGRPIKVFETTPFYCYAICDIDDKLRREFENMKLVKTPDGEGYFDYNGIPGIRAYVEVISYDKLLKDAMKRNKILFNKLGIDY